MSKIDNIRTPFLTASLFSNSPPFFFHTHYSISKRNSFPAITNMLFSVCGLHMRNGKLNNQLLSCGATFIRETETVPKYTFHALHDDNAKIVKPAMIYHPNGAQNAASITLEVWDIPDSAIGSFLQTVPAPLAFGTVFLKDGSSVYGFVSEGWAMDCAAAEAMNIRTEDITKYGGWRQWLSSRSEGNEK